MRETLAVISASLVILTLATLLTASMMENGKLNQELDYLDHKRTERHDCEGPKAGKWHAFCLRPLQLEGPR